MLTRLEVRNLAVIEAAELELEAGFTALTGETGAGKSLLVDALGLVLGDRGSAALVREGAKRASVSAEFDLPVSSPVHQVLASRELPEEDQLILHRQINEDGRSRAWANGVPVPLGVLKALGEALVEIHGQHEHLALASPERQRHLFDAWAQCEDQAWTVHEAAQAVRSTRESLARARDSGKDRAQRADFLKFQLRELDELAPQEGDYESLFEQYEQMRHREQVLTAITTALDALENGDTTALALLDHAREALSHVPPSAGLGETGDLLAQAEALGSEAAQNLQRIAESDTDPAELDALNERIARYQALGRKHGVSPAQLHVQRAGFTHELEEIDTSEERQQALQADLEAACRRWFEAAAALTNKRVKAAPRFAAAVTKAIREMGMRQARFSVALEPAAEGDFPAGGAESVRFEVATGEGQTPRPISQVASGGELSRLALAIEVLAHGGNGTSVMVFDEVDAGISGRVAELVGRQLKTLAANAQVLCVTHLPQVGALADQHFAVRKVQRGKATTTKVERLDAEERVEAIAAMLGGVRVSETARKHARDLLDGETA